MRACVVGLAALMLATPAMAQTRFGFFLYLVYHGLTLVAPLLFGSGNVLNRNGDTAFKVAHRITRNDVKRHQFRAHGRCQLNGAAHGGL